MDILAHGLWVGVGVAWLHRHRRLNRRTTVLAVGLAVVPCRFWVPLSGWWSHIQIDVFTHSADFYPSPVFYPVTYWGFDGIAGNTPWFMVANYLAMLIVVGVVWLRR